MCLEAPIWLEESAWTQHLPFAMYLVSATRPRTFVELGSFRGTSYSAFCQAVRHLETNTRCYAVDTWEGDRHSGSLESAAFLKLKSHHDELYSGFSTLLKKTFDEALGDFEDGSVDLLHIDGFHTYEAVSHDFTTWAPKLSDRAIVLFHDTEERASDFGVWRFWAEVAERHPNFSFLHGHGLGVLAVGKSVPEGIGNLFSADEKEQDLIRRLFHGLGAGIERDQFEKYKEVAEMSYFRRTFIDTLPVNAVRLLFREGPGEFLSRLRRKLGR